MNRYSDTERLGVIETDRIVTKYLGWIFREQPIVDVGIDALLEQSVDGDPKGRFLAAQIKTGRGNFYVSDKTLTYYVSHIHYNYWLNLDIPIILIAHIPESEKTYWQVISDETFKKSNKRWKIEIPIKQELNEKSKDRLTQFLSSKNQKNFVYDLYKGRVEPENLFDYVENTNCIRDAVKCILNIVESITDLTTRTNNFNARLGAHNSNGLSDKDPQVRATLKGFGKDINICSKRLESEIELFSELYSEGFYAYEQVVLYHYLFTKDKEDLQSALNSLQKIPKSVDDAVQGIYVMRGGVSKIPNKYAVLKEAKKTLLHVIDLIINEFTESKKMADEMRGKINLENLRNANTKYRSLGN